LLKQRNSNIRNNNNDDDKDDDKKQQQQQQQQQQHSMLVCSNFVHTNFENVSLKASLKYLQTSSAIC
jgi:hypothetical protein